MGVKYPITEEDKTRSENNFRYHEPKEGQPNRYNGIRVTGKAFADLITQEVPPSRERSLALTKIEEACFWANAGIARNE